MKISAGTNHALKRLHSLTGVLPVGVFLCFHLFINSQSIHGPRHFNTAADAISTLPYVSLIEILAIALPILFHMVLGAIIITTGQVNLGRQPYERNWMYVLQRASGLVLVIFIIYHVWTTRLSPQVMHGDTDLFSLMEKQLASPGVFLFYVLGVVCAAFHLGNGLFGFAIHWGLAGGRNAQRNAARLGYAVALVLALVGVNSLYGFRDRDHRRVPPVRFFERVGEATAAVTTPPGPATGSQGGTR